MVDKITVDGIIWQKPDRNGKGHPTFGGHDSRSRTKLISTRGIIGEAGSP
jgi:hypothetical protein